MGLFGMRVEAAANTHARIISSAANGLIDAAANDASRLAMISFSPHMYGVQPAVDKVLTAGSASTAQVVAGQLRGVRSSIEALVAELGRQIESQSAASAAVDGAIRLGNVVTGLWGASVVRRYDLSNGRVQYGPLWRHPNDPRRNWSNQRFGYNSQNVFTGNNYSSRWVNHNRVTQAYGRANTWISNVGSRIPAGVSRALGPIGAVVGFGFTYSSAYDSQIAADQGKGYTLEQTQQRANVRGVSEAVGSTVGAVALGAVGAAIGGPIGAAVGGMLGGWLGGMAGGLVADWING